MFTELVAGLTDCILAFFAFRFGFELLKVKAKSVKNWGLGINWIGLAALMGGVMHAFNGSRTEIHLCAWFLAYTFLGVGYFFLLVGFTISLTRIWRGPMILVFINLTLIYLCLLVTGVEIIRIYFFIVVGLLALMCLWNLLTVRKLEVFFIALGLFIGVVGSYNNMGRAFQAPDSVYHLLMILVLWCFKRGATALER